MIKITDSTCICIMSTHWACGYLVLSSKPTSAPVTPGARDVFGSRDKSDYAWRAGVIEHGVGSAVRVGVKMVKSNGSGGGSVMLQSWQTTLSAACSLRKSISYVYLSVPSSFYLIVFSFFTLKESPSTIRVTSLGRL